MMASTIAVSLHEQVMGCLVCNEMAEIPRRLLGDQEQLLNMHDTMLDDHRECAEFADHPAKAKLHRGFRKRAQAEVAKAELTPDERKRRRYCAGIGRAGRHVT